MLTSPTIVLRDANEDDTKAIAAVCESNAQLYDSLMPGAFQKQAEQFRNKGLPKAYDISVIELDHQVIGFIGTIPLNQDTLYLVAFYLHIVVQRQGIGETALQQLIKNCKQQQVKEIILLVHQQATWAKAFYKKNGFLTVSNNEEDINAYREGILEEYYLPSTVLMQLKLTEGLASKDR